MSAALNRDAYAWLVLDSQRAEEEKRAREYREDELNLVDRLEKVRAQAQTAEERAASLADTLSRLPRPPESDVRAAYEVEGPRP